MILPLDYARCANDTCPMRNTCLRFTDRADVQCMWYAEFAPDEDGHCFDYIANAAAKEEARKAKADAAAAIPVLDKAAALLPRVSAYIDDLERRHRRRGIIILATTAAAIIASAAAALLAMQLTAQRSTWSAPSVQPPASTRLTVVTDGYVDLAGHWRSFDNGHEIEVNAWRQPHAQ